MPYAKGKRPGTGRKPLEPGRLLRQYGVMLYEEQWEWLSDGAASASARLRNLIEIAMKKSRRNGGVS